MVSKPCQPTSASPSRPSMHYLDMHISCLEGLWETHIGQSSRSASLNKNLKRVRNILSYEQSTISCYL